MISYQGSRFYKIFVLLKEGFGQFKLVLFFLMILSFLNGVLEGIGISAIVPIFSFINQGRAGGTDAISKFIENIFIFFGVPYTLKFLLLFIILLFAAKAVVLFSTTYFASLITAKFETSTRYKLFGFTLKADWPYLSKQKIGHLDQAMTTDINASSGLLFNITSTILLFMKLLVYIIVAINLSFIIAVLAIIVGLMFFLILKPFFYKNKKLSEKASQAYKNLAHYANENIFGMKTVKSMAVEVPVENQAKKYFDEVRDLNLKVALTRNITNALMQPVGLIFIMSIFVVFYKVKLFDFASFVVIVYAINQIFLLIQALQAQLHGLSSSAPYLKSIIDYQKEAKLNEEINQGTQKFSFKNLIEFKDINFSYNDKSQILRQVNFEVKKGEMVGLIGPSGAGKTTIVDLLLRLLKTDRGEILLDGVKIDEISLADWRANVGYVSQDIFLMNDTIANNIRFYNEQMTEREIEEISKVANIYEFIDSLPEKFNTIIGERGIMLSGGQRQRIILARVLARKQQVLILDEATSALDNESEKLIQKAIEKLRGKITILVIAHRLSTVTSADRLIVLDDGKIIEHGMVDQLLKDQNGYFHKVYNLRRKI